MKKFLFAFLVTVLFAACSPKPSPVAEKFMTNVAQGKYDEAKKYCTEPTAKMLDMISSFGGAKIEPDFKYIHVKDSVADNRAWVTYKESADGSEQTIDLVKIDGDWKVHMEAKK